MQEPQPDNAEEAVGHGRAEVIATTVLTAVAVALTAIWLGCLSAGVGSRISHKIVISGPCLIIIVIMPFLVWSVCAMLRVVLFLMRKLRLAPRIADIDDPAMLSNGSDNVDEPVQPPIQPPVVPIIPNSSSSSDGDVRAGGNVASAADLQVAGESHHQRSEREREIEMSGEASAMAEDRMLDEDRWCC